MRENHPDRIILHCAATTEGMDIGAKEINQWHKDRGWEEPSTGISCGYHFVIRLNGHIESFINGDLCRREDTIGAHCRGYNTDSLGVCFVGSGKIRPAQLEAWMLLYKRLNAKYSIPVARVKGHNEYNKNKDCPGFEMNLMRLFMERELYASN